MAKLSNETYNENLVIEKRDMLKSLRLRETETDTQIDTETEVDTNRQTVTHTRSGIQRQTDRQKRHTDRKKRPTDKHSLLNCSNT